MSTTRSEARARALRTARVVTLGLALAGASGCTQVTDAYCGVFPGSETCCTRMPGYTWDPATRTCNASLAPIVAPPPFVGPFVPPPS